MVEGTKLVPSGPYSRPEALVPPVSPFLRRGGDTRAMMRGMLVCLTLAAVHFAVRFDTGFFIRYLLYLLFSLGLEALYGLLRDGRPSMPSASTAVTAALLVLSIPSRMPWHQVCTGLFVALVFGKFVVDRSALRVNPMLLGRLFMMVMYPDTIQQWLPPDSQIDALTSATVLGLHASEGAMHGAVDILFGNLSGTWEDFVAIIPGSPGAVAPVFALACGVVLYWRGLLDWRAGTTFVAGFAIACAFLKMPVFFHLLSGALIFSAVFLLTDPRSMPGSKAGRLLAGLLAGILNALVRKHGFYPEGIVLAVLPVNLLSPTLDRIAFTLRGARLRRSSRPA
jgi:electron transport complex protein RnfD